MAACVRIQREDTVLTTRTDEEIIKELANPFKTNEKIDERIYETLHHNLPYHGIAFVKTSMQPERMPHI